jgi:hypothetical protein
MFQTTNQQLKWCHRDWPPVLDTVRSLPQSFLVSHRFPESRVASNPKNWATWIWMLLSWCQKKSGKKQTITPCFVDVYFSIRLGGRFGVILNSRQKPLFVLKIDLILTPQRCESHAEMTFFYWILKISNLHIYIYTHIYIYIHIYIYTYIYSIVYVCDCMCVFTRQIY